MLRLFALNYECKIVDKIILCFYRKIVSIFRYILIGGDGEEMAIMNRDGLVTLTEPKLGEGKETYKVFTRNDEYFVFPIDISDVFWEEQGFKRCNVGIDDGCHGKVVKADRAHDAIEKVNRNSEYEINKAKTKIKEIYNKLHEDCDRERKNIEDYLFSITNKEITLPSP